MPQGSDDTPDAPAPVTTTAAEQQQPQPEQQPPWLTPWRPRRPAVVIKGDLLPAISVLSAVALLGMGVGWLWSRLAPPERMRVVADGRVPLFAESYHRFDDLGVFVLLSLGAGLVTGLGTWMLRERRGPVLMIAAVLGSAVAAWLATRVGISWAEGRYVLAGAPNVGDLVTTAPRLETGWGIMAWPLATALTYGVFSAWNGMDDLGRRLG